MKNAIVGLMMIFSAQAFAGASNVVLACKSADGKVKLSGYVPGDFAEFQLKAEIAGNNGSQSVELFSRINQTTGQTEENGRIVLIEDLANAVYTLQADDKGNEEMVRIALYALPKSVKYHRNNGTYSAAFTGKLTVSSENGGTDSKVACSLDYSI